nr:prenyltransferase [Saprospiraceae bacterium]
MLTNFSHSITHLRFTFSIFLLPVFLFALSGIDRIDWVGAAVAFVVLHFLIYPASNGYNSLMDKDKGSIGGVKKPPKAPAMLFPITLAMDALGILLTLFWSPYAAIVLVLYILASRAYSWRRIRLKRLPWIGFLV